MYSGFNMDNYRIVSFSISAKMGSNLNQDDLADVAAEVAAVAASFNRQDENVNEMNINEKITKLNDVRQRLSELKSLVADYEVRNDIR